MYRERDDGIFVFLLGMVAGAFLGGLIGLLYAPKKGKAFRNDVKTFVKHLPERLEEEMEPYSPTRRFIDKTRANIERKVDKASQNSRARRLAEAKHREEVASGIEYN